ncbi:MAG TPA: hypothetical protein VF045_03690, partial [Acidimicrobiales bacterium]
PAPAPAPASPPRPVTAADVLARPEPPRVTARGRWSATLEGTGERVRFYAPVVAVDALSHTTVELSTSDPRPVTGAEGYVRYSTGTSLAFPDGTRWYPLSPFRMEGTGGSASLTSATAGDGAVRGTVDGSELARILAAGATASGRFVQRDGQEATTLRLPGGTRLSADCPGRTPGEVPTPCPGQAPAAAGPVEVSIDARPGLRLQVDASGGESSAGNGEGGVEIEVAGSVRAKALGRNWEGLVGSIEADDLKATATWAGHGWTVNASARSARQVWIDVWPVVGTTLEVRSGYDGGPHSCTGDCSVRLRYRNVGHATAQIFEAEALGGSYSVALGIKQTGTHDAGLDVHRGGREINLSSGRGVDSHLPPGDYHDRGLTVTPGVPVTLVLRGNFPEVRVALAIPASRA